ncbi:IclR family transcriptional regulator [Streptomyces sp. 8L]|uniref:IclR family transcriptional regulator n=1 Tax=Streptomyces sp. 8L TaxID=2877242 RepID=UPI001CD60CED|nr:IclR family transcriptional regulator [Streptomyces sp. 8L]MCA1219786.1 IclR family transcriptional regulator [Streptomyces sp. 8L]
MGKPVNTRRTAQEPVKGPVDKAMEVLEALVEGGGGPHRLAELARRTGLTKPTVHRHLRTMAEHGFAQPAEGGSYRPGPRLLGLAAAALDAGEDLRLARPVLADLRQRTGLLAYYAVRDAGDAVFLELSEPAREYRMGTRPGGRAPLHRTAAGLAMLSALPAEEAAGLLDASAPAPNEPLAVRAALAEAVRLGYALDDEWEEDDARAAAAPVLDGEGRVVGAIAVRGLTFALDDAAVEVFGPMVRAAARTVSAGLGGRPRLGVVPTGRDGGRM